MNRVFLMGRLTADPELNKTQSGLSVARFTVAVSRRFKKEGQPEADFIRCIAWRQQAEFVCKYFKKGNMIAAAGSIQTGSYEKNGQKVYTTDVLIDEVRFTGERTNNGQNSNTNTFGESEFAYGDFNDDDCPF